uniref:Uncharacterized protein n=1 Tax=Arundo donax TaxID=35708 RepID=A0A0A9FY92_ARUDO
MRNKQHEHNRLIAGSLNVTRNWCGKLAAMILFYSVKTNKKPYDGKIMILTVY